MRIMSKGAIASSKPAAAGGISGLDEISNLEAWWDATDVWAGTEPSNDDPIGDTVDGDEWVDLSGNGYDLAQDTTTKQPTYKTNIQNSKPGILFDGGDVLKVNTSAISQGLTVVLCWKRTNLNGSGNYFFDGSTSRCLAYDPGTGGINMYAGSDVDTTYDDDTNAHYGLFIFDGANSKAIVDGTDYGTINPGAASLDDFVLGARFSDTQGFEGYFFEVGIYSSALSGTDVTDIGAYFSSKWNI